MSVDCVIEDARWEDVGVEPLAEQAMTAVIAHLNLPVGAEAAVLACDDARIATLNAEFREKPSATNVLSWPSQDLAAEAAGGLPQAPTPDFDGSLELGDIAISYDTCAAEAAAATKPMPHHVTHLLVHGILHLLGYDHVRDLDATLMERTEADILGKLGLDDPYYLPPA